MKNVLYCGFGWPSNIGNAFVDYGVLFSVKNACPDLVIQKSSNMNSWLKYKYFKFINQDVNSYFDLRSAIDSDFCIFSGALLNRAWLIINSRIINNFILNKKKIIIYGGGGGNKYDKNEINYVRSVLKKLNIYALISRDRETFNNYSDLAQHSYDGIDCAFFLNDCFNPSKINISKYVVYTFDSMNNPKIETDFKNIIYLNHSPWDLGRLNFIILSPLKAFEILKLNSLISDYPDDYLNIYANCEETYSDRVHACVAALSFGKKARYFGKSDRSLLFERIGLKQINNRLVSLDIKIINNEKQKQISFLKKILT